jgi:hypothetical protein
VRHEHHQDSHESCPGHDDRRAYVHDRQCPHYVDDEPDGAYVNDNRGLRSFAGLL